jgi:hypothetical protein
MHTSQNLIQSDQLPRAIPLLDKCVRYFCIIIFAFSDNENFIIHGNCQSMTHCTERIRTK